MFTIVQILLICLVVTVISYDTMNIQMLAKGCGATVLTGFLVGVVMGDAKMGLLIGGTMELMGLGLAGFGGASVPNYRIGAAVGVAFAVATNSGLETALVIGIPTATLGVQFDVFAKMFGSVLLHMAEKAAEEGKYKKSYNIIFWGNLFGGRVALNNTYPVLLFLLLGSTFVDQFITWIPAWLTSGLTTVGNVLPALGMAILLKYLPVNKNIQYLILGFVLVVYFNLSILPIAILGLIIAIIVYQGLEKESNATNAGGVGDE